MRTLHRATLGGPMYIVFRGSLFEFGLLLRAKNDWKNADASAEKATTNGIKPESSFLEAIQAHKADLKKQ